MLVKELVEILKGLPQDTELVVRNHANDEDDTVGNAYEIVEVQEGYFDGETGNFFSVEEVDTDEDEVFGTEAVAITFESLD
jgi:hypothetical protein